MEEVRLNVYFYVTQGAQTTQQKRICNSFNASHFSHS